MTVVRCPTCFHRARWSAPDHVDQVLVEGGARRPAGHSSLAAWEVLRRVLDGELGPVIGRCPHCAMPLVAEDEGLPALDAWSLPSPDGTVIVTPEGIRGPDGPLTVDAADAFLRRQLRERVKLSELIPSLLVGCVLLGLIGAILLVWLGSAAYLLNWYRAVGTQGDFSGPVFPGRPGAPVRPTP